MSMCVNHDAIMNTCANF